MLSSFTPIDQNQDCVAENSVNVFQGNINDDALALVLYEQSTIQWLFHEEYKKDSCKSAHTGSYNTDPIFGEYEVEEDVQISVSSFTKISNNDRFIYDHHDTESKLDI